MDPPMDSDLLPTYPPAPLHFEPSLPRKPPSAPKEERRRTQRARTTGHLRISLSSSLPGVACLLAKLLVDEPTLKHLFPNPGHREEWLNTYCRDLLSRVRRKKGIIAVAGTEPALIQSTPGVIAAYPPGKYPRGKIRSSFMKWKLVLGARNKTTGVLITEGSQILEIQRENHPKEPHWFIAALGVETVRRREGIASELLEIILKMAEKDEVPVYTRTSCEETVKFFASFGFQSQEVLVFDHAPDVYMLVKRHQPRNTASQY